MLAAHLTQLDDGLPPGLAETLAVVDGVDDTLTRGLARPGEPDAAAWAALAAAVGGTPLAERAAEAVRAATTGALTDAHLAVLAGARAALLGAAHDALLHRLDEALHRSRSPWATTPPGSATGSPFDATPSGSPSGTAPDDSPGRAGARAWLHELALAGWRGADHELLSGVAAPVEAALGVPALRRLAVLLDGLAAELRTGVAADPARVPARRWADLWARAVLLTAGAADETAPPEPVSGRLLPLGVDVHEHDTAFQAQLHALLEPAGGGTVRLVRVTVAAAKVATIVGPAGWRLLEAYPVLLKALAERRSVTVTDMPAHGGDLRWVDERAALGDPADPFATARVLLADATAAATPPLQRHPAAIAEPVLAEGRVTRDGDGALLVDLGGRTIPLATDRLPAAGPLTPALLAAATACVGLLRWDDGRWLLQPLAVRAAVRKQTVEAHNGDWACGVTDAKVAKAEARAGDAVAVLRERAGRLLRR
ncbi:hypothetical protein [Micromonospora sp. WMMD998]|uniref:hypothetical protein n=1 Tax=Micromonospora sp. WMMD998 TaxID=3016092 RepID=UPI00249CDE49|nr:hypothetical protein [Micromonospora sp. WMMD998]WFE40313.1 hypothetical protein O7619_18455 [Micromonospora sp. WMMD998]